MLRPWIGAAVLATALAGPAGAEPEEIVVTAQRQSYNDYRDTPHIALTRRADNLITTITVVCDTREPSLRAQELAQTLRNLLRSAAASGHIGLSTGSDLLIDFTESNLERVIQPDGEKAETSKAAIVVKTPIQPADSFDSATARIRDFVDGAEKAGRTEVLISESWQLSIVEPERSRPELLRLIAEDARQTAASFGSSYEVALVGLQNQMQWYQSGPLELALYIDYGMTVTIRQP